jgi:hypothetical protein
VAAVEAAEADRFAAMREGRATEAIPSNAPGLASDYAALADEVLAAVNGLEVVFS